MEVVDIERKLSELRTSVVVQEIDGAAESAADFRAMIDAMESLLTEVKLEAPNPIALDTLYREMQHHWTKVINRAIGEWNEGKPATSLGTPQSLQASRAIVDELGAKIVEIANRRTAEIKAAAHSRSQLSYSAEQKPFSVSAQEPSAQYLSNAPTPTLELADIDITKIVTEVTRQLGTAIESHPESKSDYLPVLEQLVRLSLHLITSKSSDGGEPPRGPVDTAGKRLDDDGMEARIANLEKFAEESRKDLRSIDVRLGKVETLVDGISKNMATKADIAEVKGGVAQMETTILKWFIGTAIALASVAFAAAKYLS